jgi:hypothetical protein
MSAVATPAICEEQLSLRRDRRPCSRPDGVTIGQLLTRAHETAQVGSATACPMCGGEMAAAAGAREARCGDCGTRLS